MRLSNLGMTLFVHVTDSGYVLSSFWDNVTLEQAHIYSLRYLSKPDELGCGLHPDTPGLERDGEIILRHRRFIIFEAKEK